MKRFLLDIDINTTRVYKVPNFKKPLTYTVDGKEYSIIKNTLTSDFENDYIKCDPTKDAYIPNHFGVFDSDAHACGENVRINDTLFAFLEYIFTNVIPASEFEIIVLLSTELIESIIIHSNSDDAIPYIESILECTCNNINANYVLEQEKYKKQGKAVPYNLTKKVTFKGCLNKQLIRACLTPYFIGLNSKHILVLNDRTFSYGKKDKANKFCEYKTAIWHNKYDTVYYHYTVEVGNPIKEEYYVDLKYHYIEIPVGIDYKLKIDYNKNKKLDAYISNENLSEIVNDFTLNIKEPGIYRIIFSYEEIEMIIEQMTVVVKENCKIIENNSTLIKLEIGEEYDLNLSENLFQIDRFEIYDDEIIKVIDGKIIGLGNGVCLLNRCAFKYNYSETDSTNSLVQTLKTIQYDFSNDQYYNLIYYAFSYLLDANQNHFDLIYQDEKISIDFTNLIEYQRKLIIDNLDKLDERIREENIDPSNVFCIVAIDLHNINKFIVDYLKEKGYSVSNTYNVDEYNRLLYTYANFVIDVNGIDKNNKNTSLLNYCKLRTSILGEVEFADLFYDGIRFCNFYQICNNQDKKKIWQLLKLDSTPKF